LLRDHLSLYGGWYQQNIGRRQHFYFSVACAPSRRIKRKRVEPAPALDFLEEIDPGAFSYPPTQSLVDSAHFEVGAADCGSLAHEPNKAARLWSNGRIELFYRAAVEFDEQGEATIDLAESVVPARRLGDAVRDGHYRRLYGLRRWRRVDWLVQLSNAHGDSNRGWREWGDLKFAGSRPVVVRQPTMRPRLNSASGPPSFGHSRSQSSSSASSSRR
jgi:hypothetical protein